MNLKLTIVDTVGYGDQVNKTDRFVGISKYSLFLHLILTLWN